VTSGYGISNETFYKEIGGQETYRLSDSQVQLAIKHQVLSTPTFFINEIQADNLDSSSTGDDWTEVIENLLRGDWYYQSPGMENHQKLNNHKINHNQ